MFLVQPLDYDILLLLEPGAEKNISLGNNDCSVLGRNAWMVDVNNKTSNLTMPLSSY